MIIRYVKRENKVNCLEIACTPDQLKASVRWKTEVVLSSSLSDEHYKDVTRSVDLTTGASLEHLCKPAIQ